MGEPRENVYNEDKMAAISEFLRRPNNYDWLFADSRNDNDPEEFDRVIRHIMGLNYEDDLGEATMYTCYERIGSPDFERLMRYGCDVNLPDKFQLTPLHLAVLHGNVDMAHDLLEQGADLDVQDLIAEETPLFYAIKSGNMELTCMLLCYGADVTIKNAEGRNALTYAMNNFSRDIIAILIDYYDDFNDGDKDGYMPLHLVIKYGSDLAIQFIDRGADVNYVTDAGECMLQYAIKIGTADLFKKIWGKINVDVLLEAEFPVLATYINYGLQYNTKQWVECLHLLLESSIAADLIDQCRFYCTWGRPKESFITQLLNSRDDCPMASEDRQNIISICLSLGAEVTGTDLGAAMERCGFEGELEMLIYATDRYQTDAVFHPLLPLVIGSSDTKLPDMISRCINYIKYKHPFIVPIRSDQINKVMGSCMGFVSLTPFWKLELLRACPPISICNFARTIAVAWEFPSLLELSRNRVHSLVREGRKPQKPYQFFDAMKSLPLPGAVIDLLLFKRPIYTRPDQFNLE